MSRTKAWLGVAAALALAACHREGTRDASVVVQVAAPLSANVQLVELRIFDATGGVAYDQSFTLTRPSPTGNVFVGTFSGLPVGVALTFDASAVDDVGGATYVGQTTATLGAGLNQVSFTLQEIGVPPFQNHAPVIRGVSASALVASPGATVTLGVDAVDPDGDPLSYSWSVSPAGGLSGATTASPTWAVPSTEGIYTFTVEVTDSAARGGTARASLVVFVSTTQTAANVSVRAVINNAPTIQAIGVAQPLFDPSGAPYPTELTLTAQDGDGPASLTFAWEVDASLPDTAPGAGCAGDFVNGTGTIVPGTPSATTFEPITEGVDGMCALLVTVTDGGGAVNTGKVLVQAVAPPTDSTPYLLAAYQSATSVPDGGFAVVSATFAKTGTPLETSYVALDAGLDPVADVTIVSPYVFADPNSAKVSFTGGCGSGPVVRVIRATAVDPVPSAPKDFTLTFCAP